MISQLFEKFILLKKTKFVGLFLLVTTLIILPLLLVSTRTKNDTRQYASSGGITTIVINNTQQIGKVAQNFAGLSTEEGNICTLISAEATHPELDTYLRNLSPLVLRIAANSSDNTTWNPIGTGCTGSNTNLVMSKSILTSIFAIAKKNNMQIIWGVNLKANDPTTFAQEAAFAVQAGGSNLLAIEIGNEPDLYNGNQNGASYNDLQYKSYLASWESYYKAIKQLSPNVLIEGPDSAFDMSSPNCTNSTNKYFCQFLRDEGSKIALASSHSYFSNSSNASITRLLDSTVMQSKINQNVYDVAVAKALPNSLPVIETEEGSVSSSAPSVGNVFASALWGLDYLLSSAEKGMAGIDFYGRQYPNDPTGNNPIAQTSTGTIFAQPLYYAVLMFHNLTPGVTLVKSTITATDNPNLVSHTVLNPNGSLTVFLINKDTGTDSTVQVLTPSNYTSGSAIWLKAPSLTSLAPAITLGGSSINNDGTWNPTAIQPVPVANNTFTIIVPHANAVAITLPLEKISLTPPLMVTPTITPTPTPALLPTPSVTIKPSVTVTPITKFSMQFALHLQGIGAPIPCETDSVCPTPDPSQYQYTISPAHLYRDISLYFYPVNSKINPQNDLMGKQASVVIKHNAVKFNPRVGNFTTADASTTNVEITASDFTQGQIVNGQIYTILIKVNGYLRRNLGTYTVLFGQNIIPNAPIISMNAGDFNDDNILNLEDYQTLIACFPSVHDVADCNSQNIDFMDQLWPKNPDQQTDLLLKELSFIDANFSHISGQ